MSYISIAPHLLIGNFINDKNEGTPAAPIQDMPEGYDHIIWYGNEEEDFEQEMLLADSLMLPSKTLPVPVFAVC